MKTCPICQKTIEEGDKISVVSYPLKALDADGGYNLISDFFEKEKIYHYKCFATRNKLPKLTGEDNDQYESFAGALEQLYDKNYIRSNSRDIKEFLQKEGESTVSELIQKWMSKS